MMNIPVSFHCFKTEHCMTKIQIAVTAAIVTGFIAILMCNSKPVGIQEIEPDIYITDSIISPGDTIMIDASDELRILMGSSGRSYAWSVDTPGILLDTSRTSIRFTAYTPGTYTVSLDVRENGVTSLTLVSCITVQTGSSLSSAKECDTLFPEPIKTFTCNSVDNGAVTITWNRPDPDVRYVAVCWSSDSCVNSPESISGTHYYSVNDTSDTMLMPDEKTRYYFSIFTFNRCGNYSRKDTGCDDTVTVPDRTPPAPLTMFTVIRKSADTLMFTWNHTVDNDIDSLALCIRTDDIFPLSSNDHSVITGPGVTDTSYLLPISSNSGNYYCALFAHDSAGQWNSGSFATIEIATIDSSSVPVADPGNDTFYLWTEVADSTLYLDASKSIFAPGRPHGYLWTNAKSNPSMIPLDQVEHPSFKTPDPGVYVFILQTYDGRQYSLPQQVKITVMKPVYVSRNPKIAWACRTVSEGIDSVKEGETVFIDSGVYKENITIRKSRITIRGIDSGKVIIDGSKDPRSTVTIERASFILIENVRIIHGAQEADCGGVKCSTSTDITFNNVVIDSNYTEGIRIYNFCSITIKNSAIRNNLYNGIRIWGSTLIVNNSVFKNNGLLNNDSTLQVGAVNADNGGSILEFSNTLFSQSASTQFIIRDSSVLHIASSSFDSIREGIYIAPQSKTTIVMHNNHFSDIGGYCIWFDGSTISSFSSENDTMESYSTPLWCNGLNDISIKNDIIRNSSQSKPLFQKGVDVAGCENGGIGHNIIKGFAIGIIINSSPLTIQGNTLEDSIGICIQSTQNDKMPVIEPDNDTSGCSIGIAFDCLDNN